MPGVAGEVGGTDDQPGHEIDDRAQHVFGRVAVAICVPASNVGSFCSQPAERPTGEARFVLVGARRIRGEPGRAPRVPRSRVGARGDRRRGSARARRRGRRSLPGAARGSPSPRDLVGAERDAVRGRGVLHLGRRVTDVRAQHDERRPAFLGHRRAQPGLDRVGVFGRLTELHDVPAVRLEALRDVVAVRERGVAVDRDVVVVVDEHEAPELQVARRATRPRG